MFLPKIEALGDVDEEEFVLRGFPYIERLPQAISQNARLLKISKMILAEQGDDKRLNSTQALQIAFRLCQLLDEFYNRNAKFEDLHKIVPDAFSQHWQKTLDFLDVVISKWQEYKRANNLLDEVERRNLLLMEVADFWRKSPPKKPIVIAGTTATIPATQELICSISESKNGYLVLYGLDRNLSHDDYTQLEPTHPQYNLAQLLHRLEYPQVRVWGEDKFTSRQQLLHTALLPKWRVEEWQGFQASQENMELIACKNGEEEASIIAMILREHYEQGEGGAALVSNNKLLAMRVQNKLDMWGIVAANSHSSNMEESDFAQFIILLAEFFASRQEPVKILALFKHRFVPQEIQKKVHKLEKTYLRGLRPENFCISEHLKFTNFAAVKRVFENVHVDLKQALLALVALAEEISDGEIWAKSEPRVVEIFHDLLDEIAGFGKVDTLLIPEFIRQLFGMQSVGLRSEFDTKIEILSLIEARFTDADLVIMSGLNEGDFPQISNDGDLLNQQMRRELGLDLPERRIGQQAHDFELLSQAKRVVYTRAQKDGGAPTVPSRFVQALTSLIKLDNGEKYQSWLAESRAAKVVVPCAQPRPTPASAVRPQKLAVTQIEKLMRDPYMVYADKILGLRKPDDIDAEITPADFGNFVHKAIEKYNGVYDGTVQTMINCAEEVLLNDYQNRGVLRVFWLPRFAKIAAWVVLKEREARKAGKTILVEYYAETMIGDFCLHARADRLEVGSESLKIIDYKTGAVPSTPQVVKGIAPQVSLESVIFFRHFGKEIEACEFWQTKGRDDDKITTLNTDIEQLITEAEIGVSSLISLFNDSKTPYLARPRPNVAMVYNDYAHLARIKEWE